MLQATDHTLQTGDMTQVSGAACRVQAIMPPTSSCSYRPHATSCRPQAQAAALACRPQSSDKLQATGNKLQAVCYRPPATSFRLYATCTGYRLQASGCRPQGTPTGYTMAPTTPAGFWLQVTSLPVTLSGPRSLEAIKN